MIFPNSNFDCCTFPLGGSGKSLAQSCQYLIFFCLTLDEIKHKHPVTKVLPGKDM